MQHDVAREKVGRRILLTGRFIREIPRTGGSTSSSAEVLGYDNVSLADAVRAEFGDAVQVVERPTREQLAAADVVLLSAGTIDVESFERPFALPKEEEAFIRMCVEANPNTIVLVNSGSGIRMSGWNDRAAAVIYGWYPGQNGMTALAGILSGRINPSGKLPITIEREFADSPAKGTMPAGAEFYNKAPRAFLRSPPSPASPSLFFLRRSVFRPFYFITIMYTLFESKTPIVRSYLLKSLFATGGG